MPDVTPTAANVGQAKGDKHVLTAGIGQFARYGTLWGR